MDDLQAQVTDEVKRIMTQIEIITGVEEERKQLIAQSLTAHTPAQIEQATCDLRQWLSAHPEDIGMEDLFEVLALRTPAMANASLSSQEAA